MVGRIHCGAMEGKPNPKGEFSSEAEKLLNYLLTAQYQGGSPIELDQQQKTI